MMFVFLILVYRRLKMEAITSGEDLAKICRDILPEAKVIILTMFNESYRIHNIVKNINPDGFLIKSDLTSSELAEAFHHILSGSTILQ